LRYKRPAVQPYPEHDGPFQVVFVCTGNRARSPLAEALFRKYAAHLDATVSSFGTLALGAVPALPDALEVGFRLGVDLTEHTARHIRSGALAEADLVLGFEPAHVSIAVVEGRADAARTFLLGELVALLEAPVVDMDALARARALVYAADRRRIRSRPDRAGSIGDPLGKPAKVMRRTAEQIDRLVQDLVVGLFGPGSTDDPPSRR
jgi:protein-tyrosine-phosphatase